MGKQVKRAQQSCAPWRQLCAGVMETSKISPEEVEAEIAKVKANG